ncbi:hypothetical protein KIN20_027065 [Parelaphostrongylus tenuis]|uniref:Uncharacterized protein n=1 Tax=Parelaphostrongylus tenuis TaxID=148309 RepID=A0AAD5WDF8_PARTN|nr:hypothetical protein KIN20_027065 [Parelaphostrongylus tenuis]
MGKNRYYTLKQQFVRIFFWLQWGKWKTDLTGWTGTFHRGNHRRDIGRKDTTAVTRTSRRKCPLGAYVEIIEDSRPVRSQSVESCNVVAARGADPSVQCPLTAATEAVTNSSDSSQPPPTGNGKVQSSPNQETATNEVKSNQCLIVPQNFEILMRCAICMEIFHNPANVTPYCSLSSVSWTNSGMEKDAQFNEVVQSFLVTNPTKRRSSSELEALDAAEADYVSYQNRGHARTRRRGSVPQTRSRTSAERIIRSPFVVRVSHIRAHRAPLTNRQRGERRAYTSNGPVIDLELNVSLFLTQ